MTIPNRRQTANSSFSWVTPNSLAAGRPQRSAQAKGCGRQAAPSPCCVAQENKTAPYSLVRHPYRKVGGGGGGNRAMQHQNRSNTYSYTFAHVPSIQPTRTALPRRREGDPTSEAPGWSLSRTRGAAAPLACRRGLRADARGHSL